MPMQNSRGIVGREGQRVIWGITIAVHLLLVGVFSMAQPVKDVVRKKVTLHLTRLPPPQTVMMVKSSEVQKPAAAKARVVVQPKKAAAVKKPVAAPVKKSAPPATVPKPAKKLLTDLKENMAQIEKKPIAVEKSPPVAAPVIAPTVAQSDHFSLYALTDLFQERLSLPEKGAVKLSITVQPNGQIGKIEMISSESQVNLDYLRDVLPTIKIAEIAKILNLSEKEEISFVVTFCEAS